MWLSLKLVNQDQTGQRHTMWMFFLPIKSHGTQCRALEWHLLPIVTRLVILVSLDVRWLLQH